MNSPKIALALLFVLAGARCATGDSLLLEGEGPSGDYAIEDGGDTSDAGIRRDTRSDDEVSCDPPEATDFYQPCYGDRNRYCNGENASCVAYTPELGNTFCASLCTRDSECPTLEGFEAACNFAWCAVLCDDGECPDGMVCSADAEFIDRTGKKLGLKDVCVIALEDEE